MSTGLLMIVLGGACLGGWALLSLLGAERQRLLNEMEAARRRHAPLPVLRLAKAPSARPATKAGRKANSKPMDRPKSTRPSAPAANAR